MKLQFIFHDIPGAFFIEKFAFAQIKLKFSRIFVMQVFSLAVAAWENDKYINLTCWFNVLVFYLPNLYLQFIWLSLCTQKRYCTATPKDASSWEIMYFVSGILNVSPLRIIGKVKILFKRWCLNSNCIVNVNQLYQIQVSASNTWPVLEIFICCPKTNRHGTFSSISVKLHVLVDFWKI